MANKKILLFTILMGLVETKALAYDIAVENDDEVTIYYNFINNNTELEVAQGNYSKIVVIPNEVTYQNRTMKVTSIDNKAFLNCASLSSVTIPNNLIKIGDAAFDGCSSLVSVTINSNTIASHNYNTSYNFSNIFGNQIERLIFGDGIKKIGAYICSYCRNLTSISLPYNINSIGEGSFQYCSSLYSIVIPNSLTFIDTNAFRGCSSLSSITIPSQLTSIGNGAFSNCNLLFTVTINSNTIASKTYSAESNLSHIFGSQVEEYIFGEEVNKIGKFACHECNVLSKVALGNNVKKIEEKAFYHCNRLVSINIPNSVSTIGYYSFGGCTSLSDAEIPNNVTLIDEGAFAGCGNLKTLVIPNSVITINRYAFYGCNFSYISIGSSINSIGEMTFGSCQGLTDVYCYASNVPSTYSNAFDGSHIENVTLHVPEDAINQYKAKSPWKSFKTIVEIVTPKCEVPTIYYDKGKILFKCATDDVIFYSTITNSDINSYTDNEVQLTVTYNISVYAAKEGFENSDVATATLCWMDLEPKFEETNDVTEVEARALVIKAEGGLLTIEGAEDNSIIKVYDLNGVQLGSSISTNGIAKVNTSITRDSIVIVRIGNKNIKFKMQ